MTVTDEQVDLALKAWFSGPQCESDMWLERSMRAAITAALSHETQSVRDKPVSDPDAEYRLHDWPLPDDVTLPALTQRGLAGQVMDLAWPHYFGNNLPAEFWSAFAEGVRFTLHVAAPKPVEPFCYVLPGDDNARDDGSLDARVTREGEFTQPLYRYQQPDFRSFASGPAAKPVEPEPVAWRYKRHPQAVWNYLEGDMPRGVGAEICQPLYAHPAPTREAIRREAFEEAAKIADVYAARMHATIQRQKGKDRPTFVAECKADAGESLATAIRERAGR